MNLSRFQQQAELPTLKTELPEFRDIGAQTLQEVLDRLDKSFKNFFRRFKAGSGKPGFPRFKAQGRYNSYTLLQHGYKLDSHPGRLVLTKIGGMKIKQWKDFPTGTKIKRLVIKRSGRKWYAVFCCELPDPKPLRASRKEIGLDMGLKNLVMDSNGAEWGSLTELKKRERKIRVLQQAVSSKKRGSQRRKKACKSLGAAHDKLRRHKTQELHKISKQIVKSYGLIGMEKLDIRNMLESNKPGLTDKTRRGMKRNIQLAAWHILQHQITYKAEEAGRKVVLVDPRGTTQVCSRCGTEIPKRLSDRWHWCFECHLSLSRDHNAAREILRRARQA
jgi:putative transposase